ncbi:MULTISPECIES: fused MFS/spermidine synthase [Anaeromyxobacter]|uniref:fused MFS/spermidine synthase n=1 Tax=Anaeromyxobacter TaxID=161492 RepID=UPI001F5780C2|nr:MULTISPECIES: fused MFS/spermidine synthase [unclassified Anaeromyxobacter]
MKTRLSTGVAAACFFASGAAALLYEVVWFRLLSLTFGHTVFAVTTVLAAYMGGLALGSLLLGKRADGSRRPLLVYGLAEIVIGLYCLTTPLLFAGADAAYIAAHRVLEPGPVGATLLQFSLSALLLVPATAVMGATLPFLSRAVVERSGTTGSRVGLLYAVNTMGAVLGVVATGFGLLPTFGLRATVWIGVALNLGVGIAALLLERTGRGRPPVPAPSEAPSRSEAPPVAGDEPAPSRVAARVALAAIGISGAASMAYEVAWTRALCLAVGSSTYAFTAMLATFLVGLAGGAFAASQALRRWRLRLTAFGVLECAVAALAVATLPVLGMLPQIVLQILGRLGLSHESALLAQFGASFLVMIVPSAAIGATFPLVLAGLTRGISSVGDDVGRVYGANTIGTIVGSVGAGFVLVPQIGIHGTVVAAAAANLAAGLGLLLALDARPRRWLAALAAASAFAIAVFAVPRWDRLLMTSGVSIYAARHLGKDAGAQSPREKSASKELLFYAEGLTTTVSVTRTGEHLFLSVDGKTDASTNGLDMRTQLLLGHLPALLAPDASRALVIGLGSGITAGALAQYPLRAIDVAELEPAVVDAARLFARENHDVLGDARLRVIAGDGRHILAAAAQPYDLIVSEPSNPWIAGVANLFTREFYRVAREHLSDDGVMVQWLQSYAIFPSEIRMVVRTFREVFPDVTVWRGGAGDYLLVGGKKPLRVDLDAAARRIAQSPGARADLARYWGDPEDVLQQFVLSEDDTRRFAEGASLNTDDLPLLEFAAPRAMYASTDEDNDRSLRSFQRATLPPVVGASAAARLDGPEGRLRAARAAWLRGDPEAARDHLQQLQAASEPGILVERARLLIALGNPDEAARLLDGVRTRDERLEGYRSTARYLADHALGRRIVHEVGPWRLETTGPAWAFHRLGNLLMTVAVSERAPELLPVALEQFEAASALEPGTASFYVGAGKVLLAMGRRGVAEPVLRRAAELEPKSADAHYFLGLLYEDDSPPDAAREYEAAARLAPSWQAPRERLMALRADGGARDSGRASP